MNLFLFAHQDDEYGVYPVLEQLVSQGEAISVSYLTSGTLDGQRSDRRNRESTGVLARLGIANRHIHFLGAELGFPDGKLLQHLEPAARAVLSLFDNGNAPTRIFTPAWEGGHQDHDATYIIACYLAQRFSCLNTSRQFPLYHGHGLPGSLWHTFSPLAENGPVESHQISWRQRLRYLHLCLLYRSQWLTWMGLYPMYALNLVTRGRQYLQPLRPERLNSRPHPGPCLYERRGFCKSEEFGYHTKALIDKITR
ncbi:MAG: PIG-L family deacetylase [Halioglobus sp.]|nr:PIG-L family deacetylase [Halioglobus sp.]